MLNYVPEESMTEKKVDVWPSPKTKKWYTEQGEFDSYKDAKDSLIKLE